MMGVGRAKAPRNRRPRGLAHLLRFSTVQSTACATGGVAARSRRGSVQGHPIGVCTPRRNLKPQRSSVGSRVELESVGRVCRPAASRRWHDAERVERTPHIPALARPKRPWFALRAIPSPSGELLRRPVSRSAALTLPGITPWNLAVVISARPSRNPFGAVRFHAARPAVACRAVRSRPADRDPQAAGPSSPVDRPGFPRGARGYRTRIRQDVRPTFCDRVGELDVSCVVRVTSQRKGLGGRVLAPLAVHSDVHSVTCKDAICAQTCGGNLWTTARVHIGNRPTQPRAPAPFLSSQACAKRSVNSSTANSGHNRRDHMRSRHPFARRSPRWPFPARGPQP